MAKLEFTLPGGARYRLWCVDFADESGEWAHVVYAGSRGEARYQTYLHFDKYEEFGEFIRGAYVRPIKKADLEGPGIHDEETAIHWFLRREARLRELRRASFGNLLERFGQIYGIVGFENYIECVGTDGARCLFHRSEGVILEQ